METREIGHIPDAPQSDDECPLLLKYAASEVEPLRRLYQVTRDLFVLAVEVANDPARLNELGDKVRKVRHLLARERFAVGFMGPFQVGKSTLFNRVLGAHDDIASEGGGTATTAAITRLFPRPEGAECTLGVHYLSETQFEEKLGYLKGMTNLADQNSPAELLQAAESKYGALTGPLKPVERVKGSSSGTEYVRDIDVKYLGLLIKSYSAHRARIRHGDGAILLEPAPGDAERYKRRAEFLNHPPGFNKPDFTWAQIQSTLPPIVATVDICYPTGILPQEIVVIDTPGLGSMGSIDKYLVDRFTDHLDGAIVFPDASKPTDGETEFILRRLREHFGHAVFKDRVWVVGAKADGISKKWAESQDAGFSNYKAITENWDVSPTHISFATIHPDTLKNRFGAEPPAGIQNAGAESITAAWSEMLSDGGISRLRAIMHNDLAPQIGASCARECRLELCKAQRSLRSLIAAGINTASFDDQFEQLARNAHLALRRASTSIRTEPDWFAGPTKELHSTLEGAVSLSEEDLKDLHTYEAFEDHSSQLERKLIAYVRNSFTHLAYEEVRTRVIQPLETDRSIEIPGHFESGLSDEWENLRNEDLESIGWWGDYFPSFTRSNPFDSFTVDMDNPFVGPQYVYLIREKMRAVSQQVAQIFRQRLGKHLDSLEESLKVFLRRDRRQLESKKVTAIREALKQLEGAADELCK